MNRVAITGLGVISPVGQDIETVYANLRDGVCGVGRITRFDPSETKISVAAEVKDFDPEAFGISRGDTRRMDLFTQYAMAAAQQAVDDSGIVGAVAPERLGVYVGSGIGGMNTFMAECKKLFDRGPSRISPLFIPMMIGNIAAGNIAIRYGCKGPSLPVVTACATSTNTIGEAFHAIRYGYADAILAGGSEATVNPLAIGGFANCKRLPRPRTPRPPPCPLTGGAPASCLARARPSSCWKTTTTPLRAARTSTRKCAAMATPATPTTSPRPTPRPEGGARAIRLAYEEAGSPEGLLYINAHGTGTPSTILPKRWPSKRRWARKRPAPPWSAPPSR